MVNQKEIILCEIESRCLSGTGGFTGSGFRVFGHQGSGREGVEGLGLQGFRFCG